MKRTFTFVLFLASSFTAFAGPLSSVYKYNGAFIWVKLGVMSGPTVKSLSRAKSVVVTVTFSQKAVVKKDSRGNAWFTFILADQGSDWKWHQTSGSGMIPLSGGVVKPGTYRVSIPVAGIPSNVLADKMQTISVGPAASGLVGKTAFTVDSIKGQ